MMRKTCRGEWARSDNLSVLRRNRLSSRVNSLAPQILYQPYFYGSAVLHVRACHGHFDCVVIGCGLDLEIASEYFFRLGVWSVGDAWLAPGGAQDFAIV